jgi:hypothetical protein
MSAAVERARAAALIALREVGTPAGLADLVDLVERLPRGWVITAAEVAVEELERYELANEGMIVTSLDEDP